MSIFERIPPSPPAKEGESNLIPLFGAPSQAASDSEVPPATWDSLEVVGESDVPSTRPAETPRSQPLGDFGFTGTFISEDIVLAGSLDVRESKVTLWAGGTQLASWKAPDCQVRRLAGNNFAIEADDEMITFTADDPDGLTEALKGLPMARTMLEDVPKPTAILKRATPARVEPPPRSSEPVPARPSFAGRKSAPAPEMPATDLPEPDMPERDMPKRDMPERDMPERDMSERDLSEPDMYVPLAPGLPPGSSPRSRRPLIKAFEKTLETRATKAQVKRAASAAAPRVAERVVEATAPIAASPLPRPSVPPEDSIYARAPTAAAAPQGGETIADRIAASAKRGYKTAKAHRWQKADIEKVAIKAGVVAAAIGILTLAALTILTLAGGFGEPEQPELAPAATTTLPRVTATTAAAVVTTLPPPPTGLFQSGVGEFTARWNALAEQSRPELALQTGLTSPFVLSITPYITLEGSLDPTAGSITLRATPTGTSEGDGQILTALGLLIGTSDPTLEGPARRALLESLGLAVQSPQLGGLDGTVSHNALTYHLVYLADQGVLELRVTPEVATVAGTTAPGTTVP